MTIFHSLNPLRCQWNIEKRIKLTDQNHLFSHQFQRYKMQPYPLYRSVVSKTREQSQWQQQGTKCAPCDTEPHANARCYAKQDK